MFGIMRFGFCCPPWASVFGWCVFERGLYTVLVVVVSCGLVWFLVGGFWLLVGFLWVCCIARFRAC